LKLIVKLTVIKAKVANLDRIIRIHSIYNLLCWMSKSTFFALPRSTNDY